MRSIHLYLKIWFHDRYLANDKMRENKRKWKFLFKEIERKKKKVFKMFPNLSVKSQDSYPHL